MAWTTLTFAFGSVLTSAKMTSLQDNFTAVAQGLSGAPKILSAAFNANSIAADRLVNNSVGPNQIAAGGVHTSELNTGTGSTSTTAAVLDFTMTGGMYVFAPQGQNSTVNGGYLYTSYSAVNARGPLTTTGGYATRMAIGRFAGTSYAQWRYVAASPPHDMGDGDIPMFLFAILDSNGDVESISSATDPVWQANGPTDAMPTIRTEKGLFKVAKDIPASFASLDAKERAIAIEQLPDIEIEITEAIKHADMDIIPHPFQGNDLTGKTVVMLDPVSDTVRELCVLNENGEDIHKIIRDGHIKIGNTGLNRVTPKGLLIPSTTWKQSA